MVKRKGIGYTLEGFLALLTILIFAISTISAPQPTQDWNEFQEEVTAQDITHTLKTTGHLDQMIKRGETGSIATSAYELSDRSMQISGNLENIPIEEKSIGFHIISDDEITDLETQTISSLNDQCEGQLGEIDSEHEIRRTVNQIHDTHLYFADTDPRNASGFDGEINYDTFWVDNSTRCQFQTSDGPFYENDFFFWGDREDEENNGEHYKMEHITDDGSEFDVHFATQIVNIRDEMKKPVNGIQTDIDFNTFRFVSTEQEELEEFDAIVFRETESLNYLDNNRDIFDEYIQDNSMLALMNLEDHHLDNQLSFTGLQWIDLEEEQAVENAEFTDFSESRRVEMLFQSQSGELDNLDLEPGGSISSAHDTYTSSDNLVGSDGTYDTDEWNAANFNLEEIDSEDVPAGTPDSECDEHREGVLEFPEEDYYVVSTHLGDCDDIWGVSIDLNDDGDFEESDEGPFVNGDSLVVDSRSYGVIIHPETHEDCEQGECVEFVFNGDNNYELVNYKTSFEELETYRFARMSYQEDYNDEELKLISSLLFWMTDRPNSFGADGASVTSISVPGLIENKTVVPYRLYLRWHP